MLSTGCWASWEAAAPLPGPDAYRGHGMCRAPAPLPAAPKWPLWGQASPSKGDGEQKHQSSPLIMGSSLCSLLLSARQHQLSDFNFIHKAAITPSGSRRMNTNGSLDCFKCRSEPDTHFHFVRAVALYRDLWSIPSNQRWMLVCVFVRC